MARIKEFDEKQVLQKAVNLFWDKGFNGTSMQDMVETLGISRSSLYDTFGGKHQLFLKALESYKDTYGSQLCAITQRSLSARAGVAQVLDLVKNDLLNDKQRRGCFMVNAAIELASHDSKVNNLVCQTETQLEQAFCKMIEQGQANGEISKDKDALALARFLNNTVKGIQVSAKSTKDQQLFDDIIRVAVTILE